MGTRVRVWLWVGGLVLLAIVTAVFAPALLAASDLNEAIRVSGGDVGQRRAAEEAIRSNRQAVLWAAGGMIAVLGLTFTWFRDRNAREKLELDRDANFTTRYTEAVAQLGSDSIAIRLGGVYALERIAEDSRRDFGVILNVLAAFARLDGKTRNQLQSQRPEDVTATLLVVLRMLRRRNSERVDLSGVDLSRLDLDDIDFRDVVLVAARFADAHLSNVNFSGVDLTSARFAGSTLADVNFSGATLVDADFVNAKAPHGNFRGAHAITASFNRISASFADFTDADLRGANLEDGEFTGALFVGANLDGAALTTELDTAVR